MPTKKTTRKRSTRRSTPARPRLGRTLLATFVLAVVGFSAGLVTGALWETPATLLGPFHGDPEAIDLSALEAPTGDTRAPEGDAPGPVERVLPPPTPEPPPVAAAPPAGPFVIQVGSFEEPVPAWKLAEQLGEKEYAVFVDEGQAAGKPRWRVRVGPVDDRDEADRLARRLKAQERLPTWIVAAGKPG